MSKEQVASTLNESDISDETIERVAVAIKKTVKTVLRAGNSDQIRPLETAFRERLAELHWPTTTINWLVEEAAREAENEFELYEAKPDAVVH